MALVRDIRWSFWPTLMFLDSISARIHPFTRVSRSGLFLEEKQAEEGTEEEALGYYQDSQVPTII